jgi:D-ribose pyranose/furanose isomerase RbsD
MELEIMEFQQRVDQVVEHPIIRQLQRVMVLTQVEAEMAMEVLLMREEVAVEHHQLEETLMSQLEKEEQEVKAWL